MTRMFKAWLVALLTVALFTPFSTMWLDRPIAFLVRDIFGEQRISLDLTHTPILSVPLISASIFVVFGLAAMMGRRFSKVETAVLLCDISILAVTAIKDQLKLAFGRTWPDSWEPGILSLLHDNAYGFHFFQAGHSFESFPSGHAAVVAAAMSVLWIWYPRLGGPWAICIVAADLTLVGLNLHFLSDVVAGSFVGVSTGLFVVAVWGAGAHRGPGAAYLQA